MRRAIVSSVVILLALLTGCSNDEPTPSPPLSTASESTTSATTPDDQPVVEPCAEACSNQEVGVSGCDGGKPQTVGKPDVVPPADMQGVTGIMELRMSDPAVCDHIYWARFRPYAETSDVPWVVEIEATGFPKEDQPSDPYDPAIDGFTEGVYAPAGTTILYCLDVGDTQFCSTATAA